MCVPFPHIAQFICPSMLKGEKWKILCAFWNLNALKAERRIARLSLLPSLVNVIPDFLYHHMMNRYDASSQNEAICHQGPVSIESLRPSFLVWDFYYKDKMVKRPSYLYNGNPYAWETAFLSWAGPLISFGHYRWWHLTNTKCILNH